MEIIRDEELAVLFDFAEVFTLVECKFRDAEALLYHFVGNSFQHKGSRSERR